MMPLVPALVLALAVSGAAAPAAVPGVTYSTANSVATGEQDRPAVAANRANQVAVTWQDARAGDGHSEIYLRLFTKGASTYEIKLSAGGTSGTAWKHATPDVGLDDRGDAVVVWAEDADGNGYYNIAYRVVAPTGTILGSGVANANTAGQQTVPKVAVDPDGAPNSTTAVGFTVVWEDVQGTSPATVRAAGYTNVTTKAYEVAVSQATGSHHNPDVATSASGDALVVWDEDADANGYYNIDLVRLARTTGAVTLSRRTANVNGGGQQEHAAVAANYTGDFAISWESDHTGVNGVWTRSFASDGTPRAAEVETSTGAGASSPTIGIDDQDDVVVGWTVSTATDQDVWLRGLNGDGTFAGRLGLSNAGQVSTGPQHQLAVVSAPSGSITFAYTDDNDGNGSEQILLGQGAVNSTW